MEIKHIKINAPIPLHIKEAIENKREWIRKIQAGEIKIINEESRRRVI